MLRRLLQPSGRRLLLTFSTIVALAACGGEAASPSSEAGLPPLPPVDLSTAEPAVRGQLTAARAELEAVLAGDAGGAERAAVWGRVARLYHLYELYEPALVAYAHAGGLAPREARWAYLAGVVHQRRGDFAVAREAFQTALTLADDDFPAARFRQAETALAAGDVEAAARLWEDLVEEPAFAAAASAGLGRLELARGDGSAAVAHLERALELQPAADALRHSLSRALRSTGRPREADAALERAGDTAVTWPDPQLEEVAALRTGATGRLWAASRAAAEGDLDRATAIYEDLLVSEPGNLEALQGLAGVLAANGDPGRAVALLSQVVERRPGETGARLRLARLLELTGEGEAALDHYRRVAEESPEPAEHPLYLAAALQRAGRPADAVAVYDALLARRPDERRAVIGRAQALAFAGDSAAARRAIERHLSSWPDDVEAGLLAGQLAAESSDVAAAEAAFRQVLAGAEATPQLRAGAAFNLGVMSSQGGRPKEAARSFAQALELAPDMIPARVALARILLSGGDPGAAADHLATAVSTAPADVDLRLLEAQALAADGRPAEALARVEAALGLFPGEPRLLAARRSLAAAG